MSAMLTDNLERLLHHVQPDIARALRKELVEAARQEAIETVKCRYDKTRYQTHAGNGVRKNNAELLGLTAVGRPSAFASLVAVHPRFDDMVIKVVPWWDAGACYARACHEGMITGPHAPVVYAVHRMDDNAFIYMEKLIDINEYPENIGDRVCQYIYVAEVWPKESGQRPYHRPVPIEEYYSVANWAGQFRNWNNGKFSTDFHSGNIMARADGTLVFIDPVHGTDHKAANEEEQQRQAVIHMDPHFMNRMPRDMDWPMIIMDDIRDWTTDFGLAATNPRVQKNSQQICKGKPHKRFIDHNIRGFKRN